MTGDGASLQGERLAGRGAVGFADQDRVGGKGIRT